MKYFLKLDSQKKWQEVTREDFIKAERGAGFFSEDGRNSVATSSFTGNVVSGRTEEGTVVISPELKIQNEKMKKTLVLLSDNGWNNLGKSEHPIKYPGCHKIEKGQQWLFVSPMKEDYRCIEIWSEKKSLCGVNTLTMKVCDLVSCDIVDTDVDMIDLLNSLKGFRL